VGDAEADFIVSGRSGKGILLVVADRRTRHVFLERILPVSVRRMERGFLRIKARFPELRTLTTDNDILFRHHARLAALLRVRIFFCHPYHSWEKGTVEHVNKIIRRGIPKGSDISRHSRRFIEALEAKLNRRPMNVLCYRTPAEMLARHRARSQKQKTPR
jgi:IS30 family transposase